MTKHPFSFANCRIEASISGERKACPGQAAQGSFCRAEFQQPLACRPRYFSERETADESSDGFHIRISMRPKTRSIGRVRQTSLVEPDHEIVCVDCGGRCFLISYPREDGRWYPGDVATYRCQDCRDRWDLVVPDLDVEEP